MNYVSFGKNTVTSKEYELYDEPSTADELDLDLLIDKLTDDYLELVNISERFEVYLKHPVIAEFIYSEIEKRFESEFDEWLFSDTNDDFEDDWDDDFEIFLN